MDSCHIVLCPCPSRAEALDISRSLVEEKLAAAVNVVETESVHRWDGEVRQVNEFLLMIKSREKDYAAVERKILSMHSYKLAGIASVPIDGGSEAYLEWICSGGDT